MTDNEDNNNDPLIKALKEADLFHNRANHALSTIRFGFNEFHEAMKEPLELLKDLKVLLKPEEKDKQ